MFPRHSRPINSNNNTLAVFPLPCIRKVLRIDSWLHLTTIFSTNIASSIFYTRCTSLFTSSAAGDPLPSFPKVGWRKLWRRSDTSSMLQGIYSPFLYRDYSLYYKCVQSAIECVWKSSKITTCISVLPGNFPTFMTSFLTLWHHPPEGPFSPDGSHLSKRFLNSLLFYTEFRSPYNL